MPLLGRSDVMRRFWADLERIAPTDARVLLIGETGVGKEVAARHLHAHSAVRSGPFVVVNCAGVPDPLLASELFGHRRGSFTGAHRDRKGMATLASGGTLFLDEVGEMSASMQGLLLRFAEQGEIQPLGADEAVVARDVRLVSATNRDLQQDVRDGVFREDLYFRLNVVQLRIPPLRERPDDILPLFAFYLQAAAAQHWMPVPRVTSAAERRLREYAWPGNIRELRNLTERVVLAEIAELHTRHLPGDLADAPLLDSAADPVPVTTQSALVDALWARLLAGEPFWDVVEDVYRRRALTREGLSSLVTRGLQQSGGSYRRLLTLFNLPASDYKRLHGYLYQRNCHIRVRDYTRREAQRDDPEE